MRIEIWGYVVAESPAADLQAGERRSGRVRALRLAPVVLVAVPLVLQLLLLIGKSWAPAADHALEVLRIDDVGGRHTPLVGAYSRFGWYHPGPLLFWLLAGPYRIFGVGGTLAGALLINLAAVIGAVVVAGRRGGLPLALLVAGGAALLSHAMGPELIVDPWNPWICVFPFFVYALLMWSVAERDWTLVPWGVGVGSFVVQSHLGYAPLVVGLGIAAAVLAGIGRGRVDEGRSRDHRSDGRLRRAAIIAGVVGLFLWLPPLIQQFTGDGNLGELVTAARDPEGRITGWADGFGLMGTELDVPGPLIRGDDRGFADVVPAGGTTAAVGLVLVTALLGWWAHRRGAADAGRLSVLALAAAGLGVVAASRITGLVAPYLLRWSWVVALLLYLSCVWSLWSIVRGNEVLAVTSVLLFGVFAVAMTALNVSAAAAADAPAPRETRIIESLGRQMAPHLVGDDRILVRWAERDYLRGIGPGIVLHLANQGFDVRVPQRYAHAFSHRDIGSVDTTDATVRVVGKAPDVGALPAPGEELVAVFDTLTSAEQRQVEDLRALVDAGMGAACGPEPELGSCVVRAVRSSPQLAAAVHDLAVLDQRSDSYRAFLRSRTR